MIIKGELESSAIVLFELRSSQYRKHCQALCSYSLSLASGQAFRVFLDDKRLKRAGLDYWDKLEWQVHDSWNAFLMSGAARRLFFVETGSNRLYTDVQYHANDCLVFGSETKGLPFDLFRDCPDNHISIPMVNPRSLNLANTVAIVLYEAWRQLGFKNVLGE